MDARSLFPEPVADPYDRQLRLCLDQLAIRPSGSVDLGLSRTRALFAALGNPQDHLPPSFHVAGSNGKGSIVAYLRAITHAAGLTSHVMTSPHLVRVHERIVLQGSVIETPELVAYLERVLAAAESCSSSFFELLTAAGFLAFAEHPADFCIIEVGMGGRFDATNILPTALASVISVISFDHVQFLGTRLDQIAREKAGIMKAGRPCIIAPQTREGLLAGVMTVFEEEAARLACPLYRFGHEWSFDVTPDGFTLHTPTRSCELPAPNLVGPHQTRNAATAVMALLCVEAGLQRPFSEEALGSGLTSAQWPGRLLQLSSGPLVSELPPLWEIWVDGAHNDAGGAVLAEQARLWADKDHKPLHLIVGMISTKNPRDFLAPVRGDISSLQTVDIPEHPLSLSSEQLATALAPDFAPVMPHPSLLAALRALLSKEGPPGRILITGSLYLAGHVLMTHR